MTARVGTKSIDGTPISQTDLARIQAEDELHAEQKTRAARVVAAAATDVEDCRMLLSILGLDATVVAAARRTPVATTKRSRKTRAA